MFAGIVPGSGVPPSRDEIRNDQWLGVAVTSQGPGEFLSIIYHYHYLIMNFRREGDGVRPSLHEAGLDYRWGQGQCFTLTNKLKFDETWEPCRGRDTYRSGHMIHNVLPVSMYVFYVCTWRHAVPLKVLSSSGPSPGEGQRKVWKVRGRLAPAPKSIPYFLVFTITLYHQLDLCIGC